MRVCLKCGQTFADDTQRFCLTDGTPLIDSASQPTIAMSGEGSIATAVTPRSKAKRRPLIWILGGSIVLVIGAVALAAIIFFSYRLGRESARKERSQNINTVSAPRSSPTSVPVSVNPSPETARSTNSPANSDTDTESDEITPISWTTSGAAFKQDVGTTYRFNCPEKGTPGTVWGSDVYTADSSICTAAVHAGVITLEQGGDVTIEFKPGRLVYGSTTRNGITSNTYGQYPHSFVVRAANE